LTNNEFASELRQTVTHPAPRQPGALAGGFDHGHITLTLTQPLSQSEYNAVKKSVSDQQVTSIPVLSDPFVAQRSGQPVPNPTGLTQPPLPWPYKAPAKYPPLPQFAGFNVWGPLRSVTFNSATGNVSVGDTPVSLAGAPNLTLWDVKGLRSRPANQELVTAPLETSQQSATFRFRAVANVTENGTLVTSFWEEHKTALAIVTLLATVIGALIGALSIGRAIIRDPAV
jgi:hypothetical protein